MHILLRTFQVWLIDGRIDPQAFFWSLKLIGVENDILVIGSYNPGEHALNWLTQNESKATRYGDEPFHHAFDIAVNRNEFPMGKAYQLKLNGQILEGLGELCKLEQGSNDEHLFFDHVLLYREGPPILPILNFHDAFTGGQLLLSGLYDQSVAAKFGESLGCKERLILNPDNA